MTDHHDAGLIEPIMLAAIAAIAAVVFPIALLIARRIVR